MADKKGNELKNTEKEHELFPTKLAQDASLIVNLLQSRTMDKEPKEVAKTKADDTDIEKNKNIFMNNNNIQYKHKLHHLAKNFSVTTSISDLNEYLAMDKNSTPDNISKQIAINNEAQKDSNRKGNKCIETMTCIPSDKSTLNPLAKNFSVTTSISDLNEYLAMDKNSTPDNISKQIAIDNEAQKDSNRKGDGCVETLNCIPPNKSTLNPLAKNFSMTTSKSDLNEDLVTDLSPTSNYVPTQWNENEENLGQHSFNQIMDDSSEKPFSSKRKSNWIVRFFTYCFKKLSFKSHC